MAIRCGSKFSLSFPRPPRCVYHQQRKRRERIRYDVSSTPDRVELAARAPLTLWAMSGLPNARLIRWLVALKRHIEGFDLIQGTSQSFWRSAAIWSAM